MTSRSNIVVTLGIGVLTLCVAPASVAAAQEGTPGNALNPAAINTHVPRDPEGIGITDASRSPTGLRTAAPALVRPFSVTAGGLRYRLTFELGGAGASGDTGAAKYREYKDLDQGAYLNTFALMLERPTSAFHLDAIGGSVGRGDQYYGVDLGKYNAWRVRASFSEIPHVFTSTYRSLWDGVGTDTLRLTSLTPGGTTNAATTQANILSVLASTPGSDLSLSRRRTRTRFDLTLPDHWRAFATYSQEQRQGSRPFAAVFGGGGGGGNVEIPESIDYATHDVVAGLQFADTRTSFSVQATGSSFRNAIDTLTFENPLFITTNTIAGVPSTTFTQGRVDLYPSNSAYNVRAEAARRLPLHSRVTGLVSIGRSSQNDALVPWSIEPLSGGTINGVSTTGRWDSTAALSRTSANARIDTMLVDVGLLVNPVRDLTLRGKVRVFDTDNSMQPFLACNPLTGQFGRLLNNGSGGSFVTPNVGAGNNPAGTTNAGYNNTGCDLAATRALGLAPSAGDVPIQSAPYQYRRTNSSGSADYRLSRGSSVDAAYERERIERDYREREATWEDRIRVGYVNRAFPAGTLRWSFEQGRRRGSDYISVPLDAFYSSSLGPVPTATGTNVTTWFRNVDQFRRFDVADRDQRTMNLRFNHGIGANLDASVGFQWRSVEYPGVELGRDEKQTLSSPSFELNWQASTSTSAYGYYSYQAARQHQTGLQQNGCTIGNSYYFFSDGTVQTNATGVPPAAPAGTSLVTTEQVLATNFRSLCGAASASSPLFPTSRAWSVGQRDRNTTSGLGFRHEVGAALAEVSYTYAKGRTGVTYDYNPAALGLNATQVQLAGNGFADLLFAQKMAEASAVLPIAGRLSLRLLYRFEDIELHDWHYSGIPENPMPANNALYLDFGRDPEPNAPTVLDQVRQHRVHFVGAFFRYGL